MSGKRVALGITFVALAAALAWGLFVGVPRMAANRAPHAAAAAPPPPPPGRKIKARLFYVSEDGEKLAGTERDVPYGEGVVEQAREIITAQIAPSVEPLVSAIPPGTTLRAIYITPQGQAYVDLSADVVRSHPGGTASELLTIYTIVNALAVNLPAVSSVQILVDGKEVETLAGHVDVRRPLSRNMELVE